MLKTEARRKYMDMRTALKASAIDKYEDLMLIQFQQLPIDIPECILAYLPFKKYREYNPDLVLKYCAFKNPALRICYPVLDDRQTEMHAVEMEDDPKITKNKYGIDEPIDGKRIHPSQISMVLVPLLAFDLEGNRVGYGKGFFDKFLTLCEPEAIKIGCSFFDAETTIADIDQYDIPLDYCVTPLRNYIFKK